MCFLTYVCTSQGNAHVSFFHNLRFCLYGEFVNLVCQITIRRIPILIRNFNPCKMNFKD